MSSIRSLLNVPIAPKVFDEHDSEKTSDEEEDLRAIRAENNEKKDNKTTKKYISWSQDVGGYDNRSSEARLHAYLMRHNAKRLKHVSDTTDKKLEKRPKMMYIAEKAEAFFRRRGIKYRTANDLRMRINALVKKDYPAAYKLCHSTGAGAMGKGSKSGSEEFKEKVESVCYGYYELEPYLTDRYSSIGEPFDERQKAFQKRRMVAVDESSGGEDEEGCSVLAPPPRSLNKKKQKKTSTASEDAKSADSIKLGMIEAAKMKSRILAARSFMELAKFTQEQGDTELSRLCVEDARRLLLKCEEDEDESSFPPPSSSFVPSPSPISPPLPPRSSSPPPPPSSPILLE